MSFSTTLHVWGDHALFTRPEMKAERVSYDVMTPSAARGILEAIYWKPQFRWHINRIHVLKPIRFTSIRRNELSKKILLRPITTALRHSVRTKHFGQHIDELRIQRGSLVLCDVAYLIDAHIEILDCRFDKNGPVFSMRDCETKHLEIFNRRARAGGCFQRPYFGCREFPAHFALVENNEPLPTGTLSAEARTQDFGLMLHDFVFEQEPKTKTLHNATPRFFHAAMIGGIIDVPPFQLHPPSKPL